MKASIKILPICLDELQRNPVLRHSTIIDLEKFGKELERGGDMAAKLINGCLALLKTVDLDEGSCN